MTIAKVMRQAKPSHTANIKILLASLIRKRMTSMIYPRIIHWVQV